MYTRLPYAIVSSALIQTVPSTTVAYPVLFESLDDYLGINRDGGTVSINSASPCIVTCVAPNTTILAVGTPIKFTILSDVSKGITLTAIYYVTEISGSTLSFQLSSTIALARAGTPDINTNGAITGTFECVSRIYFKEKGDYEIIVSLIVDSTGISGSTAQLMDTWFVKGNSTSDLVGTIIPKSNTQVSTDRAGVQLTMSMTLIHDFNTNDFVRLDYRGSDNNLRFLAVGTATNPTRPACPSIIMTIKKICA